MKKLFSLFLIFGLSLNTQVVLADDDNDSDEACPVGLVKGLTLDDEFGAGTSEITKCLENRKRIKLVMQVNKACRDTTVISTNTGYALENHARSCRDNRGYGIAQMKNMFADYTITHGIPAKKLDLNIIVHGGGGTMLLNTPWNKLKPAVMDLMAKGVKFYFCQNTVRGMAGNMNISPAQLTGMVLPGVEYVTAGLTAVADFQKEGYKYVQP